MGSPEFSDQGEKLGFIGVPQRAFEVVGEQDFALACQAADVVQVNQPRVVDPDDLVMEEQLFVVLQVFGTGDFPFSGKEKMGAIAFALTKNDLIEVHDRKSIVTVYYQVIKTLRRGGDVPEQGFHFLAGTREISRLSEFGHRLDEFVDLNRFQEVVDGRKPEGPDGIFGVGGDEHYPEGGFFKFPEQVEAIFPRHFNIKEEEVRVAAADGFESRFR